MGIGVGVLLLSVVTFTGDGRVFAPALNADGTLVAYAEERGGTVTLRAASTGGGDPVAIAEIGRGVRGRRLAARFLGQNPWSPDGSTLLFLRDRDTPEGRAAQLFRALADGSEKRPVAGVVASPTGAVKLVDGAVDAAAWIPKPEGQEIVAAFRESAGNAAVRILIIDTQRARQNVRQIAAYDTREPTRVLDIACAPGGRYVALLLLSGARDERRRKVVLLDLQGEKGETTPRQTAITGRPNVLRFCQTGKALFYVDTESHAIAAWDLEKNRIDIDRVTDDVAFGIPVLGGAFALVRGQGSPALFAVDFAEGKRALVGTGLLAASAAGTKVALVRTDRPGGEILITDLTPEGLRKGDLGLAGLQDAAKDGE